MRNLGVVSLVSTGMMAHQLNLDSVAACFKIAIFLHGTGSMYNSTNGRVQYVHESAEAMREYRKWSHVLTVQQQTRLLLATVCMDGKEWWIASGPDLTIFDDHGFGPTLADAMQDYVSVYLRAKKAT
jgi:hypothetical protein